MTTSRAILCAWTVAAFEAGLVLSSSAHFAETPLFWLMTLLAPVFVYGTLAWAASRLPFAERLPWALFAIFGCLLALHLRRQLYIGADGWAWVLGGSTLAVFFWVGSHKDQEGKTERIFSGIFFAYLLLRLRQFSHNDPQKLGERGWSGLFDYGFDFGQDWLWALIFVALVIGIYLRTWMKSEEASHAVVKTAGCVLITPFVSAAYLYFSLQEGALQTSSSSVAATAHGPNVVLVSWDTVRADTLPLYGGGGLETPNIQRIANEGVVFENWQSVSPITAPAHNSMLTGLYPPSHGLRGNGDFALPLDTPRLPEVFQSAGWATGAFVSARPVIGRDKGFPQGFQHFDDRAGEAAGLLGVMLGFSVRTVALCDRIFPAGLDSAASTTPGATTTDRAIEWIAGQTRPAFAWVHLFDAHDPREKGQDYLPFREAALRDKEAGPHAENSECEESLVLQRGEVAFLDFQLGRLLDALQKHDPGLSNTVIALVADHGECFGEGADTPELFGQGGIKVLHAPSLYAATQHVVGVIRSPQTSRAFSGKRSPMIASHIDLLPTLCDIANIEIPEGIQGRSLKLILEGGSLPDKPIYMEAFGLKNEENRLVGYLHGEWKYVRSTSGRHEFLFSKATGDSVNHLAAEPIRAAEMRTKLEELSASIPEIKRAKVDIGAAEQARLEALGYGGDTDDSDY
ncbi:MAG TPA: sulfatase-like hydrolase/transferase [Planctomycetota bacterium]|jgi:arylsulfatase A-like enzyme|nr:sulfatase-like hydrolase/transferase [Planctomycetota bacterium]MDP7559420.1 sulfatase-like hydrolase/transferase [Planctomycetota bacterium]HJM39706.1 sulfatase-like hydrolase/transferase [Planctomycetota bacterium]|tara:strand:- start:8193 stop:10247 length:2055 start_codon:yes stop_codon:yes gene_type:complete